MENSATRLCAGSGDGSGCWERNRALILGNIDGGFVILCVTVGGVGL